MVIDSETKTREFVDKTGYLCIQVPTVAQAQLTTAVGSHSLADDADKLKKAGVEMFNIEGFDLPFVAGCTAWLACKDGRWHFETADPNLRSIHHIAGGNYYAIGDVIKNT